MNQAELLQHAVRTLESLGIGYMVVGSLASGAYGEPRLTLDIDIVVALQPDQVDALCAAFPDDDFYVSREAARKAVASRQQFNVLHPTSGNKIDFMVARDDAWGRTQFARRHVIPILPGQPAYAARPEDIILAKMWYYHEGGSEKHLRDIAGILSVIGMERAEFDKDYIEEWSLKLGLSEIWQAVCNRIAQEHKEQQE